MAKHTDPNSVGCLLEAEACGAVIKELDRLIAKYQKKIAREMEARKKDLEIALGYGSEDEIRDAYGWGILSEQRYERYMDLFHIGEDMLEHHVPTRAERVLDILRHIHKELESERQEWELSAMTPLQRAAERKRRDESVRAWKERLRKIREDLTAAERGPN